MATRTGNFSAFITHPPVYDGARAAARGRGRNVRFVAESALVPARVAPYLRSSPISDLIKRSVAMPSPLDLLLDPVAIAVFAMYAVLILYETLAPARVLPAAPAWMARGM